MAENFKSSHNTQDIETIHRTDNKDQRTYHCIVQGCNLYYKTLQGLKRHLSVYDHKFYGMESIATSTEMPPAPEKRMEDVRAARISHPDSAESKTKASSNKTHIDIKRLYSCGDKAVEETFRTVFENGVIRARSGFGITEKIFCRIPGCGKGFKSLAAYKYHCGSFFHSLESMVCEDGLSGELGMVPTLKSKLLELFGIKNEFEVSGVAHYTFAVPDRYFNLKFITTKKERPRFTEKSSLKSSGISKHKDRQVQDFCEDGRFSIVNLKDVEYKVASTLNTEDILIKPLDSFVSCCTYAQEGTRLFFCMGLTPEKKPVKMFEFKTGSSTILLLDYKLDVAFEKKFTFGFIRNMHMAIANKVFEFIALFNDGRIRSFKLDREVFDMFEYDQKNIVSFCHAPVAGFTVATDGFKLYKFENRKLVLASTSFEFPVVSLTIKDLKQSSQISCAKKGGRHPLLFYLDTNGRVKCCDIALQNEECIYKLAGITSITYVNEVDFLFLVDTFELVTRYMCFGASERAVHVMFKDALTSISCSSSTLLFGSFEGVVRRCSLKRKGLWVVPVLSCTRSGSAVFISAKEKKVHSQGVMDKDVFEYGMSVVSVFCDAMRATIVYRNGLIVSIRM